MFHTCQTCATHPTHDVPPPPTNAPPPRVLISVRPRKFYEVSVPEHLHLKHTCYPFQARIQNHILGFGNGWNFRICAQQKLDLQRWPKLLDIWRPFQGGGSESFFFGSALQSHPCYHSWRYSRPSLPQPNHALIPYPTATQFQHGWPRGLDADKRLCWQLLLTQWNPSQSFTFIMCPLLHLRMLIATVALKMQHLTLVVLVQMFLTNLLPEKAARFPTFQPSVLLQ